MVMVGGGGGGGIHGGMQYNSMQQVGGGSDRGSYPGALEPVESLTNPAPLPTENMLENTDGVLREGAVVVGAPHQCSLGATACYFLNAMSRSTA